MTTTEKLRVFRQEMNVSREELGRCLDVSSRTIFNWEKSDKGLHGLTKIGIEAFLAKQMGEDATERVNGILEELRK